MLTPKRELRCDSHDVTKISRDIALRRVFRFQFFCFVSGKSVHLQLSEFRVLRSQSKNVGLPQKRNSTLRDGGMALFGACYSLPSGGCYFPPSYFPSAGGRTMTPQERERMNELCLLIQGEKDSARLWHLAQELCEIIERIPRAISSEAPLSNHHDASIIKK